MDWQKSIVHIIAVAAVYTGLVLFGVDIGIPAFYMNYSTWLVVIGSLWLWWDKAGKMIYKR